jgi:hypothetical protein
MQTYGINVTHSLATETHDKNVAPEEEENLASLNNYYYYFYLFKAS